MHFCEEDYTVSEGGKGKKTFLKKKCCPVYFSVVQLKTVPDYFSKQRKTKRRITGGTKAETSEKNLSAMRKETWCHRETTSGSSGKNSAVERTW